MGAPLIDRNGSLLGLISGPTTVVPAALTRDVLERASRQLADGGSARAGFPWKWVGLGAAAVGLAVVLVG